MSYTREPSPRAAAALLVGLMVIVACIVLECITPGKQGWGALAIVLGVFWYAFAGVVFDDGRGW